MAFAALIDDTHRQILILALLICHAPFDFLLRPLKAVTIHEGSPRDRRNHRVAVQVFDVTDGDID